MAKQGKTMYEAWDDLRKALRKLFEPVIEQFDLMLEKMIQALPKR